MNIDSKFLTENNSFADSFLNQDGSWSESTSITKVMPIGSTRLIFEAEKPAGGTNKGYFARIIDTSTNKEVPGTYKQIIMNESNVRDEIQSENLDLFQKKYRLEFGPHYNATNVNAVGASVDLIQGQPQNWQNSTLYGLADGREFITFRYTVCKEIFNTNTNVYIYAVEGSELQGSSAAINNKIIQLKKGDPYIGTEVLEYPIGTLKEGKTYTVCMGIFSSVRQIAGYSFIAR